jgi:Histidine kinase-, DNA gyrase B-, and HSP90-like ATPase
LGKFGLGLKAASLSQCRCLTVATRTTASHRIEIAQWDLDHVEETDRWEVLRLSPREVSDLVLAPFRDSAATVVILEDLDRVFRFRSPGGRWAQGSFEQACSEVKHHLAMVFHRFLSGEASRPLQLSISINGVAITPWDPFCRDEEQTLELIPQTLAFEGGDEQGRILVRPYVLPNEAGFSSSAAHSRAAGPRRWNRQQGFYFYRNDRMIQSGGWSRLRTADEHTKLARVAVDFPPCADSMFELNVSKTEVRIPPALRAEFAAITSSVGRLAQQRYRVPGVAGEGASQLSLAATHRDPRVVAIQKLVEMVVGAAEDLVRHELSPGSRTAARVTRRLRSMQRAFEADLAHRAGLAPEPGQTADDQIAAAGGG